MANPLISVIVPTYNREELLKETLISIVNQAYTNIEIIVVDNCSKYDFFGLISTLNDTRIKAFQNQNHGIIATNRNFGIRKAQGEYIALCDDDDLWLPEKLEKQLSVFQEYGNAILLVGTNAETFPKGRKNNLMLSQDIILSFYRLLFAPFSKTHKTNIYNSSVLLRADVISKIGLFDENKLLIAVEDYDYWLRVLRLQNNSVFILNQDLIKYRIHGENITTYDESKSTVWDRLSVLIEKYADVEPLNVYRQKIPYFNRVYKTQQAFFAKKITWVQLYQSDIKFLDKIIIYLKKLLLN